ncbi:MAG: citrate lyase subunit alpha [Gracilibacteraceae bacterium]|jgi:citrate lyase subunit alpha/citrate CoA-transferase|nr:citrate lyase subunit alpha [Gracilibacteraceae bacterium]
MKNVLGREFPDYIEGYGQVRPFTGAFNNYGERATVGTKRRSVKPAHQTPPAEEKLCRSIDEVFDRIGVRDGMTFGFHHHLRNGDYVVNLVMKAAAERGLKDLHVAATGIFGCHEPLVEYIKSGVITQISCSYISPGPVAKAITTGLLRKPAIFRSHGGRPRAIESGDMHIDVAFAASPTCDPYGNVNGTHGPSACGVLSYIFPDTEYADYVVAVTDNLVDYPAPPPIQITQDKVDFVLVVDKIGDPAGIASGTTRVTTDPIGLRIAESAAALLDEAGYIKDGMSLQTGAGGASLAVAAFVRERMLAKGVVGAFGAGGITSYFVQMLKEGLLRALFDVQCFDLDSVKSAGENPAHMLMSGSLYGNPHSRGAVVNNLDIMILGATEIDLDFNVNVVTGSDGVVMGASGGHNDCSAGSKIAIVVSNLLKGRLCMVRDRVTTVTSPGETIDVLVTDRGIAINPQRQDLLEKLQGSALPLTDIKSLKEFGENLTGKPDAIEFTDKIVAVVEYRDGTVIDVVRQPK